jgi:hypothetical protein
MRTGPGRPSKPRTRHLVAYGAVTGLIATGCGGLLSEIVYGSSNPTEHTWTMIVIGVLVVAAGLSANRVVSWMMARTPAEHDERPPDG